MYEFVQIQINRRKKNRIHGGKKRPASMYIIEVKEKNEQQPKKKKKRKIDDTNAFLLSSVKCTKQKTTKQWQMA